MIPRVTSVFTSGASSSFVISEPINGRRKSSVIVSTKEVPIMPARALNATKMKTKRSITFDFPR